MILCCESLASKICKVLNSEGITCSLPKRIVFGDDDGTIELPDFEIVASLDIEEANHRIDEIVKGLPWDENWPRH